MLSFRCANYALHKTAELSGPGYDEALPEAKKASFCVDVCLASFGNKVNAVLLARDVSALLAQG